MRIDGKQIAEKIYEDLKKRVARLQAPERSDGGEGELKKKNIVPHLAVILVGENPASMAYVLLKQKKGEAIGIKVEVYRYETNVITQELTKKIEELNRDKSVHGILIQRPLPEQIDVEKLELLTDPKKDIDGFHPNSPYTLPLPLAVVKILEEVFQIKNIKIDFADWLKSQNIVVIGKGPTGGKPVLEYFKKLGLAPILIDSKTKNPNALLKKADIIISSVGRENVVKAEDIKKGVILVGVGVLRGEDRKLKGDYDEEKIKDVAGFYTPTPGGVGPVNVAMLMENLLTATEKLGV